MINLVLGIDPSPKNIPTIYKDGDKIDVISWASDIINECHNAVMGVKFQSAYFENMGLYGLTALSELIQIAKEKKMVVIMDAKRGDIGATSEAYAQAYLSPKNAMGLADFSCDYLTVNPLMGNDCITPFVDAAIKFQKGIFLLLKTSNPGADMIFNQTLTNKEETVSDKIMNYIQETHHALGIKPTETGPIGCVIGATDPNASTWREKLPNSVFLMPGIGAQGGSWRAVKSCQSHAGVWVPISRGITSVSGEVASKEAFLIKVRHNLRTIEHEINE